MSYLTWPITNFVKQKKKKNEVEDVAVSCDGTWQRWGFSSLNAVVTVLASDTGKCVDY